MKRIRKIIISDLHYGKKSSNNIHLKLEVFLLNIIDPKNVDYFIIAGDVYDKLLSLNSIATLESLRWLITLGKFCIRWGIKLRILEGTPSHDRKQISVFDLICKEALSELDFIYVTELCVILESDHTCLYIPDEINHSTRETMGEIYELLEEYGLTSFDSCVMHGGFKHNIKFGSEDELFNEDEMMSIVRGIIVCGHIHTHQIYDRIITIGSFERLGFGENSPKGGLEVIEILNSKEKHIHFLENKMANIFDDIMVTTENIDELISMFIKYTIEHKIGDGANFRLKFSSNNPLLFSNIMVDNFPNYNFTMFDMGDEEEETIDDKEDDFIIINNITSANIESLLHDKLTIRGLDNNEIKNILDILKD